MGKRFNADFTLGNCLFEPAELTDPDTDPDKYNYSDCNYYLILVQNLHLHHLQMEVWEKILLFLELV